MSVDLQSCMMFDEHISQHVKCSVEDCRFTAHKKLVKIHWRNNHAPGAKRIKLDTAEDISRWRDERRKNYPTLRNIEKKLKLMKVKEQRGDVLETAQFSSSGASVVAIDNKIEQAMDLVKSHLMFAVREEVEVLKEQIKELMERNSQLEQENSVLKNLSSPEQLTQFQAQVQTGSPTAGAPGPGPTA
ncbi:TSC22 domain family protein 3-like isoform X4 [Sinocyclocheilus anshuiensis]|uniref:TSC22 domain family protein 3-like isoform X4 n=1 Tax=Sinocyclocheilus anshuiensis TaxID=1608454 RepID=UPI0007B856E2|nr:PREDICTED: TSC22 domain family protein 3-like isoform X4 [Sinocyclocheilus anshuiensis]